MPSFPTVVLTLLAIDIFVLVLLLTYEARLLVLKRRRIAASSGVVDQTRLPDNTDVKIIGWIHTPFALVCGIIGFAAGTPALLAGWCFGLVVGIGVGHVIAFVLFSGPYLSVRWIVGGVIRLLVPGQSLKIALAQNVLGRLICGLMAPVVAFSLPVLVVMTVQFLRGPELRNQLLVAKDGEQPGEIQPKNSKLDIKRSFNALSTWIEGLPWRRPVPGQP